MKWELICWLRSNLNTDDNNDKSNKQWNNKSKLPNIVLFYLKVQRTDNDWIK